MGYNKKTNFLIKGRGLIMTALIVAYAQNRVIGSNGRIPWEIKGEQKRFKELTTGNIVIMGRKSYEEIGHPLPDRFTVVVSRTANYRAENCITVSSLDEALKFAEDMGKDAFISGGAALYTEAIEFVDKMYVTLIKNEIAGDVFFPEFDTVKWDYEETASFTGEIPYVYCTYTRRQKTG